jgi:DNA-binding NtrC family response regulator
MRKRGRRGASIQKTIQSAATPVFALNERRLLTLFNAGCEALTGWTAEDVLGEQCDYAGDDNPSHVTAVTTALCPPPEVFSGGVTASVPAEILHRDGHSLAKQIHFVPLRDAEGHVLSVVGLITERDLVNVVEAPLSQRMHAEVAALRNALRTRYGVKSVVARTPAMLRVLQQVDLARRGMSPALLRGERGVGKEHLARVIHTESETRNRSFVPLDCRTLPEFEVRQTLRRLFSRDPDDRRPESTLSTALQPGTLFLQHVEALSRDLQEFVAKELAGDSPRISVRILAGTQVDLAAAVEKESFREDLYFRLTALEIAVPPLRERIDEIPLLAQVFLEERNRGAELQRSGLSEDVLRQFAEYRWPGNLDELAAVVGEAWAVAANPQIQAADLPFRFRTGRDAQDSTSDDAVRVMPLEEFLAAAERDEIQRVLELCRHNRSRAAALLGMNRPKLYRRMEALGLVSGDEVDDGISTSSKPISSEDEAHEGKHQ